MTAPQQALLMTSGEATDPNFASVSLLCHFDGTNGQTTTTDSSSFAHTMTVGAGIVLNTGTKKFGTASLDMAGAGGTGVVSTPSHAGYQFGAGQFTVECRVQFVSGPGAGNFGFVSQWTSGANCGFYLGQGNGGQLVFIYSTTGSDTPLIGSAWSPTTGVWYAVAADRDAGNTLRLYLDGAVMASASVASTFFASGANLELANNTFAASKIPGFLDEARITKGSARYGGAYTPATAAFPDS